MVSLKAKWISAGHELSELTETNEQLCLNMYISVKMYVYCRDKVNKSRIIIIHELFMYVMET